MTIGDVLGQSKPVAVPTKSAIYVWGYNQRGLTGRTKKDRKFRIARQLPPELFGCLARSSTRWLDVARGREHTAAVASDGSLYLGFRSFPPAVLNPCWPCLRRVFFNLGTAGISIWNLVENSMSVNLIQVIYLRKI
ncbi:hypothetical protein RND81_10G155400 [Saponaria officinalis]|uniref:Uncharacterized protein n=1 Tax=Saponaria officinalis TaxID=3572 RepID=A0AAW1I3Y3_SAPOF